MTRKELILAVLAVGGSYTISRLLKTLFLVSRNIPGAVEPAFHCQPEYYGPVDKYVDVAAAQLAEQGLANIHLFEEGHCYLYSATETGVEMGWEFLGRLSKEEQTYVREAARWVRSELPHASSLDL